MAFIAGGASAGSTGITAPSFTTGTRPSSPIEGQIIYNTTNQLLEVYANGLWRPVNNNATSSTLWRPNDNLLLTEFAPA